MRAGQMVQCASPEEILRNPANDFVEEFIGKDRLIQARPNIQTVSQIMNTHPITITADRTLTESIQLMKQKRVDSLLVVNKEQILQGYIDVEIVDQNLKKANLVGEVIETEIFTVEQNALVRDTVRNILKKGMKNVPVVDERHHLVGIVTRTSLVDMVYDSLWGEEGQIH
jgi:osmoprotectant transport system ATP-binding protein